MRIHPMRLEPAVSVVVTCHNLGQFLDEAVDSVLTQSFQDFEIVIVDDGSTDDATRHMLATYSKPRTKVLRIDNRGLPAARNVGVAHTAGRYLTMLDADDCFEPTLLERSVATLEEHPEIAFVSHWFRTFGDESWEWCPTSCNFPDLLDHNTVNGSAMVRRSSFLAIGGYDERMRAGCEDWDFWISLVEKGFEGTILPEFLFRYRRRAASMSRQMMTGNTHSALYRDIAEKHAASFSDHIQPLLLRREQNIVQLRRETHDLAIGRNWLRSEVSYWTEEVAILDSMIAAQAARGTHQHAEEAKTCAYEGEIDQLRRLVEAQAAAASSRDEYLNVAVARAYELDARAHSAEEHVASLLRSWSWRITAPVRALAAFWRRLMRMS